MTPKTARHARLQKRATRRKTYADPAPHKANLTLTTETMRTPNRIAPHTPPKQPNLSVKPYAGQPSHTLRIAKPGAPKPAMRRRALSIESRVAQRATHHNIPNPKRGSLNHEPGNRR
jgi:hypothetical protein